MPHIFGNQKPISDFVIKTQKPLSKIKWCENQKKFYWYCIFSINFFIYSYLQ